MRLYNYQTRLNTAIKKHQAGSISSLKKVGILIDTQAMPDCKAYTILQKELAENNTQFEVLFYVSKESDVTADTEKWFSKKALNLYGKFKKEGTAKSFEQQNFDLLINYYVKPPEALLLLSALVNAKFKVGFELECTGLNDLSIATDPKNTKLFAQEVKKYLSIINQ